jgi:ABC-type polysaccharide/polyol phosphate transport system ATPase subunit
MNGEIAIQANEVTKIYKLYNKPKDRLKESLNPFGKKYHKDFFAVNSVSFTVKKGETLGIIGKNGSGKSTILKMITGVLTPTSGSIQVNGKISALLELGTGFNPEYTGLENIYLNGTIMGYTRDEMDRKLDDILSFADIGEFVQQPVKTYSSGMFVRLAFAVAINVDPDILIIDEALSVGDMRFQQKCFRKIDEFRESKTILFVSHDLTTINKYCDRTIWINEGRLLADGSPKEVAKKYQAYMLGSRLTKYEELQKEAPIEGAIGEVDELDENLDVLGDNIVKITGVQLVDGLTGNKTTIVEPNQKVRLIIRVSANEDVEHPIVGFTLKDRLGNVVTQSNSYVLEEQVPLLKKGQSSTYCFEFLFPNINHGQYTISPAVASGSQEEHVQHSWVHDAIVVQVLPVQRYQLGGLIIMDGVKFYTLG